MSIHKYLSGLIIFIAGILILHLGKTLLMPIACLSLFSLWGWIWGVVGMIISISSAIMLIIVCSQFDELRWITIVLSSDDDLPEINKN
ncbi:MAG: hypothetical protein QNK51_06215 [Chitinophagales bacterium]|tara:strand:+ start:33119 stop:33382 length:264 start_codon:yes stop_codon:yes gene_type:complete